MSVTCVSCFKCNIRQQGNCDNYLFPLNTGFCQIAQPCKLNGMIVIIFKMPKEESKNENWRGVLSIGVDTIDPKRSPCVGSYKGSFKHKL